MADRKLQRVCQGTLAVYFVGLALLAVGFGVPYWVRRTDGAEHVRYGLWQRCIRGDGEAWVCDRIFIRNEPPFVQAVQGLMSAAVFFTVLAGATYMFMPVTSSLHIVTAGLLVSALSIFGAQSNVERADLSWGYWLTVAAGVVLLANGLTLGILVGREGCTMDKIMPPARHNKVKAEKDVRLQNV